jgi:hypothetical protein
MQREGNSNAFKGVGGTTGEIFLSIKGGAQLSTRTCIHSEESDWIKKTAYTPSKETSIKLLLCSTYVKWNSLQTALDGWAGSPVESFHAESSLSGMALGDSPSSTLMQLWLNKSDQFGGGVVAVAWQTVVKLSSNTTWYCGEQRPVFKLRTTSTV